FLAFAGLMARIDYSDYDDSLSVPIETGADVVVVWLDFERYARLSATDLAVWLDKRLQSVRERTTAPIIISNHPVLAAESDELNFLLSQLGARLPGIYVADQAAIARRLGIAYRDERIARVAATTLSDLALLH